MLRTIIHPIAGLGLTRDEESARTLREAFRDDRGLYMNCRRGLVLTSFGAGLCMMIIGLYQTGVLRRLRGPKGRVFDSSRIAAVPPVYRPAGFPIPDALLGLVSYAITAALAGFGGPQRHRKSPALVVLMSVKVLADAVLAGVLFGIQWAWYRAFCVYCVTTSALSLVAAGLVVPETWAAVRELRARRRRVRHQ